MQNPKPHRAPGDAPHAKERQGNTLPVQDDGRRRVPRAPHEHDESADSQEAGEASARSMGQKAREDIERGLVDTDKGPVLDQTYERLREDGDDPMKKLSP